MSEKLDRFVDLLRKIFELDKSDLDFGIYRIMNTRKGQIDEFLLKRLPKQVTKAVEHENPQYILDLLLSVITVSMKTVDIVARLPKVEWE